MYKLAGIIKGEVPDLTAIVSPFDEWTTDECVTEYSTSRLTFLRRLNQTLDQATSIAVIKELKRKINELTPQSDPA